MVSESSWCEVVKVLGEGGKSGDKSSHRREAQMHTSTWECCRCLWEGVHTGEGRDIRFIESREALINQ